jgi:hypothetical protein
MINIATTPPAGAGGRGYAARRRRGYARTVSQKREARRARRTRCVATTNDGGDGGGVRRRRRGHDGGEEDEENDDDDDDDEALEGADVPGADTQVDAEEQDDDEGGDGDDDDGTRNDVVDLRLEGGDTATNDDAVNDECATDEDESSSSSFGEDDSFDIVLDKRRTRSSRSSFYKKKRRVIREDEEEEEEEEEEKEEKEEDGHVESANSLRIGIVDTVAMRGACNDRDGSPSRDEKTRDERNDVDGGTNGRIKRRSGRTTRITAKITGRDHGILLDDDTEREFLADSTMTTIDGRYVSASASDKKGGRCSKKLRRTEKILEVDHGRCFLISSLRNVDVTSMHWRYHCCLDTIISRRFVSSLAPSIPSCHLTRNSRGQKPQRRRLDRRRHVRRRRNGTPRGYGKGPIGHSSREKPHQCLRREGESSGWER